MAPVAAADTTRRARWISRAVLAFAWLLVAISCAQAIYRLRLPTEGWDYTGPAERDATGLFFSRNLLGAPTPLRPNDELLAFNGAPYGGLGLIPAIADQLRVGDVARYTVRRAGQTIELEVPLKGWSREGVVSYKFADLGAIISYVASWFLFGLSSFVLLRRPTEPSARALLLFTAAILAPTMALVPDGVTTQYSGVYPLTASLTYLIWAILLAPSLFVLALTFPQPKRIVQRAPWLLVLPYTIFWVLLAVVGPNFTVIGFGLSGVFFILSLLAIVHTIFTQRDSMSRAQLLWGFGGFLALLICFMPFFGLVFLIVGGAKPDWTGWFARFASALASIGPPIFQIMLAIGILRYRLFDIDIIIRRTLVYTVLTLALGAVYLVSVVALQALFVRLTGEASTLAVVASTLAIAALFRPLRARVQGFIDRRFFRKKYDAQQVLNEFAQRAQREADLDALSADLLATVDDALKPSEVRLWLVRTQETRR